MIGVQILVFSFVLLYVYYNRSSLDQLSVYVFICKLFTGLFFVFLYQEYYVGDLTNYISLAEKWKGNHNFFKLILYNEDIDIDSLKLPRYLFFAKVFYFFYVVSFSNIWFTAILFSTVSFLFFYESVKLVTINFPKYKNSFLLASIVPSVLFWNAGLVKEALCLPAFLMLIMSTYSVYNKKFDKRLIALVLVSVWLILKLRYFYIPLYIVLVFSFLVQKYYCKIWFWLGVGISVILYFVFQKELILQLQFQYFQQLVFDNYWVLAKRSSEGHYIDLAFQDESLMSILWAVIQSYRGMFFLSFKNVWLSIVSLENVILGLGIITSLFTSKKWNSVTVAVFVFVLVSAGFFQLVSPNYGSLSRYRLVHWFFMSWVLIESLFSFFRYSISNK